MIKLLLLPLFISVHFCQQIGTNTAEVHPSLLVQQCSKSSGCQTQTKSVVLDSNWRWTHNVGGYQNCYNGNKWDASLCPDPQTCATNCVLEGADYTGTYGINAQGNSLKLKFVTRGPYSTNIGSRLYLLDDDDTYKIFKLKNQEFTFDVDVSNLPCGLNGALYFVEMNANGGKGQGNNQCGARYGTGYCDGQCPHDLKWIDGEANVLDWTPSPTDPNSGTGKYGTCCNEMDIWEANVVSEAYTPHTCSVDGPYRCSGVDCGDNNKGERYKGVCDKDGCDYNPFRLGSRGFYGQGSSFPIDTSKPFTVVTQFITSNNSADGDLVEIRRLYKQNGKIYENPNVNVNGSTYSSVTDKFCNAQKNEFGDINMFEQKGGLKAMGESLDRGMVLVMSLWDDHDVHMLWLDSDYPTDQPSTKPGIARGTCSTTSGVPSDVESKYPDSSVTYSNIRYGEIGSTY